MKRAKIIVRENIIGAVDDDALRALNGYYESPYMAFPDDTDSCTALDMLERKYKKKFSNMRYEKIVMLWEDSNNG